VFNVLEQALKNHGSNKGDVRVFTDHGYVPMDDVSVDEELLTSLEIGSARYQASDETRGNMEYAPHDSGSTYSLTFTLETTP
jgi:hypothetical protein